MKLPITEFSLARFGELVLVVRRFDRDLVGDTTRNNCRRLLCSMGYTEVAFLTEVANKKTRTYGLP